MTHADNVARAARASTPASVIVECAAAMLRR
jgi:hypothetical protein